MGVGEWKVRFFARCLVSGTPARASPSATRFARGIPGALHEKREEKATLELLSTFCRR